MIYTMISLTRCNLDDLVNLSQAAEILGVSRVTVYKMIRRGDLSPVQVAGLPYVDKGEVEDLKRRRSGES